MPTKKSMLSQTPSTNDGESTESIRVSELVESKFCVSSEDGEALCLVIENAFRGDRSICISFAEDAEISSAFLESAIGSLYKGEFSEDEVRKKVIIHGLSDEDSFILNRITERTKDFFRDPCCFEECMDEVLGENDDQPS
jgi:hypothetical protein